MSDVVQAVLNDLADGFPGVDRATVADIASAFLAELAARSERDTRSLVDDLAACEALGCRAISALTREHDGRRMCPACVRAARMADREAARIAATHGPELGGVRVRRAG